MIRARHAAAFLTGLALSLPAHGLNLGRASPSYDGVIYVFSYPNGDKPQVVCETPDGWTQTALGTGFGEACASGDDFAMNGGGMNSTTSLLMLYQDAGSGDVEFCAEFDDPYTGATDPLASVGIGLREATTATGYLAQVQSAQNGSTVLEFKYGSSAPFTTVAGAAGQSRPRVGCITLDKSENEIRAFGCDSGLANCTEIGRTNFTFSGNPYAWAFVQSKSTTQALQATIKDPTLGSTLTVYDPDPPGPGAPTLVTPIANQTGVQGGSFSLSCAANFDGATSYSVSGLAGSTGISFNTSSCSFSGTFNANDVGTRNITVTATNAGGSIDDQFSLVVTGTPGTGSLFTLPDVGDTTGSTFNCALNNGANGATWASVRTSGTNATPKAGDTIQFVGGTREWVQISNCVGTYTAPITIKNRASDSVPLTIKRASGAKSYTLNILNSTNIVLDGTGKYSGAPAGTLGVTPGTHAEGRTQAGIVITKTAGANQPTHYMRIDGTSCFSTNTAPGKCVIKGVEIDAVANAGGTGICFSLNDHDIKAAQNPGVYREIELIGNYGAFCGAEGEGFYIGPNQGELDVPLRNVKLNYNLVDDSGRECVNLKTVMDGDNELIGNHCYRPGLPQGTTQNDAFNVNTAASWRIADNRAVGPGGNCLQVTYQNVAGSDTANPAATFDIENNMFVACGKNAGAYYGFSLNGSATPSSLTARLRNNTVAGAKTGAIDASNRFNTGTCSTANNLFADNGAANLVSGCTEQNNRKGTIAAQQFVNDSTASGAQGASAPGDFHLTSGSPACSSANANVPATDYDGQSRPLDGASEQGADEATACP